MIENLFKMLVAALKQPATRRKIKKTVNENWPKLNQQICAYLDAQNTADKDFALLIANVKGQFVGVPVLVDDSNCIHESTLNGKSLYQIYDLIDLLDLIDDNKSPKKLKSNESEY